MRISRRFLWALVSAFCVAFTVWGQGGLAVVRGTVRDTSKAVVPAAKIQLTNTDTNIVRDVAAAPDGSYYFGAIPPGKYEVTVEASGFKKWASKFSVEVGETVDIEVSLEVG